MKTDISREINLAEATRGEHAELLRKLGIAGGGNVLAGLGLVVYTEALGRIRLCSNYREERPPSRCFHEFFARMADGAYARPRFAVQEGSRSARCYLRAMFTVREINDLDELRRVEAVIAAQLPPRRAGPARGVLALWDRFPQDRSLMLVAELAGEIVGGALACLAGDAVKVEVIALTPAARGKGLGRRLMEAIEGAAVRLGARAIFLGGANADNRGFYQRLGFAGRRSLMQKGLRVRSASR
jgi:GNAT superfamily N-acetyltransferase